MKPRVLLLSGLALVLGAAPLAAQSASAVQAELARLKPTYFWTFDRSHRSVGSAGSAALQVLGGRFVADADGKEAGAQGFDAATDGLVFSGDPVTGGGAASLEADGTGSIFLLFRAFDKAPRGQRYLFSQGAKGAEAHNALALFIQRADAPADPGALIARVASKQFTIASAADLATGGWHVFALTWDEARATEQAKWAFGPLGGEALRTGAVTLTPKGVVGNDGPFAIGFSEVVDSSGFRELNQPGAIDAFAIFDRELKPEEIAALGAAKRRP